MKSKSWNSIRKIIAATSFATLAIAPLCQAQVNDPAQAHSNQVEARIRLRTDATTSPIQNAEFEFAPTPSINGEDTTVNKGSLLDSRFHRFPKADKTSSVQNGTAQAAMIPAKASVTIKPVSPVTWVAPATTAATAPPVATTAFVQPKLQDPLPPLEAPQIGATPQDEPTGDVLAEFGPGDGQFQGLKGKVKITVDRRAGKLIVSGDPADVAIVKQKIDEIVAETKVEERIPERIPLRYSKSDEISESITQLYDEEYASKVGDAEIIPLTSPNALLVFGSQAAIDAVKEIVNKIESDVDPDSAKDFKSFPLKHLSAADAKRRLEEFFSGGAQAEAFPVGAWTVVADYRSNVVVVRGNAQVLQQAELLISAIDIDETSPAVKSVRVFQLQNAAASDLANILQDAINGALRNVPQPLQGGNQGGTQPGTPANAGDNFTSEPTASRLQLETIGQDGKVITSGLLFDVRVTPDTASNSLIVRGPTSAMPLVEELIRQLDRLPNAEALIKVFQIVNGDAEQLLDMLESIFGADDGQAQQNQTGGIAELPLQTTSASPGSALVNLRFAIDQRTNSIIATGPAGDLQVVEDLLNRLDEDFRSRRQTIVYRLSNSNVLDVEEALNNLLDSRESNLDNDPRVAGGAVNADQEIVIVPELGSNSLIISTLPENFPEIEEIIRRLDRRPPMVKVKVLLAEVSLGSVEEFGIELGLQDSLLFDRDSTVGPAGGITGNGFNFNTGTASTVQNAVSPGNLAGQALSNLGVGTSNAALGYGGLVLSAGSESINVLLRALKDRGVLRVLSRPQIMTLENLQGRVAVGQIIPRIGQSNTTGVGTVTNSINEEQVGVILEITPRVSPDGMITMFVNIVNSSLGAESDGVAVAVDGMGNVINQAPINSTEAQTTVISRSGQTIVFSGLIQETKEHVERGAPILSDLPVIGPFFKFESDQASRSELLIIMTPYLIDSEEAIETQNQDEMERMHWCLNDVADVYGNTDFDPVHADLDATRTVYPGEGEEIYWSSEAGNQGSQADRISQTVDQSRPVEQVGFLNKMKVGLEESPVAKIADRIRGSNTPNQNSRNRRDFEELKRLRSQHQE